MDKEPEYWQSKIDNGIKSKIDQQTLWREHFDGLEEKKKDFNSTAGILKSVFSLGIYAFFYYFKEESKEHVFDRALGGMTTARLTPQEGLLRILDSFVGCKDKNSLKYRYVSKLFEIHARDDKEAEQMVDYTRNQLKEHIRSFEEDQKIVKENEKNGEIELGATLNKKSS